MRKQEDDDAIPQLVEAFEATFSDTKSKNDQEENKLFSAPVPVTIVSGFLGAGKTTLLNFILKANHGKRIAVIENEFGEEIGVESLIAKDGTGEDGNVLQDFYELSNGCICCSVRDDLVNTLEKLLEKRDQFDYILVETTGMANPGKVASIFYVDSELEGRIFLDGIVTLVDAKHIRDQLQHLDTTREASSQLAFADRIILNKKDLLLLLEDQFEIEKQDVEQHIRQLNGLASCFWTERARVDLDVILDIKAFSIEKALAIESQILISKPATTHTGSVQTICIKIEEPLDLEKTERFLGELLWTDVEEQEEEATEKMEKKATFFRIKGVLLLKQDPSRKFVLQAVHELFEILPTESKWEEATTSDSAAISSSTPPTASPLPAASSKCSRLVFIGLHFHPQQLEHRLRTECL